MEGGIQINQNACQASVFTMLDSLHCGYSILLPLVLIHALVS